MIALPESKQNRPGLASEAVSKKNHVGGGSMFSLVELDALAAQLDGAFGVIVETTPGRYRRRLFLTLSSAQNHVRRAQERGQNCRIYLGEMRPLNRVNGTAQAELGEGGDT